MFEGMESMCQCLSISEISILFYVCSEQGDIKERRNLVTGMDDLRLNAWKACVSVSQSITSIFLFYISSQQGDNIRRRKKRKKTYIYIKVILTHPLDYEQSI